MMLMFAWALLLLPLGAPLPTSECKSHLAWSITIFSLNHTVISPSITYLFPSYPWWVNFVHKMSYTYNVSFTHTNRERISTSSCVQRWQRWKLNRKYNLKFTCKISVKLCSYYACKQKSGMELWMRLQEPSWMPMMPVSKCCKPTLKT